MAHYLQALEGAYAANKPAPIRDKDFLPDLITGLNAADPRRKLDYVRLAALDAESVCASSLVALLLSRHGNSVSGDAKNARAGCAPGPPAAQAAHSG